MALDVHRLQPPTRALIALDLTAFRQGPVHYDRQRGRWRSELDEWQQAQAKRTGVLITGSLPLSVLLRAAASTPSDSNDCDPSRKASGLDAARCAASERGYSPGVPVAAGHRNDRAASACTRWWYLVGAGSGFGSDVWELSDGLADEGGWLRAAYGDRSLVTRVGPLHAGHGQLGDRVAGMPTSSATMPGLIGRMLRHAHLYNGAGV